MRSRALAVVAAAALLLTLAPTTLAAPSMSPTIGPNTGGTPVTITGGSGYSGATTVQFTCGVHPYTVVPATISPTSLTFVTPDVSRLAGRCSVQTLNPATDGLPYFFFTTPGPTFWVSRDFNNIAGSNFRGEDSLGFVDVTITADNPKTVGTPDIELTLPTDVYGDFQGTQVIPGLEPGWLITVTDGFTTKTHIVRDLSITFVDPATDIMRGTADLLPPYTVYAGGGGPEEGSWTTVDNSGAWMVDLSIADPPRGPYDITLGSEVGANQPDDDGDFTFTIQVVPTTLHELLDGLVADGRLPNQGVAASIMKQAEKAPPKALTNHLTDLVRRDVITQQTMAQILVMVAH